MFYFIGFFHYFIDHINLYYPGIGTLQKKTAEFIFGGELVGKRDGLGYLSRGFPLCFVVFCGGKKKGSEGFPLKIQIAKWKSRLWVLELTCLCCPDLTP